jgi:hypothetical protein
MSSSARRRYLILAAVPLLVPTTLVLAGAEDVSAQAAAHTAVDQRSAPISHSKTFRLRRTATHVAVHWKGHPHARVRVAFSRGGRRFGRPRTVQLDEVGMQRHNGETYGALMVAPGVTAVRVWTDQRLPRLSVLALTETGAPSRGGAVRAASVSQPTVIPRAGWGADESLRFDSNGKEIWPPTFWPIQKLIVHHTATQNNDPNPAATIRSIYYYHAVTQGWGDIGYNFLIDESGNVYEGRHSRDFAFGEAPTGEDLNGNGVTGAHAQGYNSGTVGIALLGTLSTQDATPQARAALERLLAWKADRHGIDPLGSSLYINPVSGLQATFPNIAGHRDVAATECPGSAFYADLPSIRTDVATLVAASSYPHPRSASRLQVSLVPDFRQTISSSQCQARGGAPGTHGTPLSFLSCNPPAYAPGTAARLGARAVGSAELIVVPGDPATSANEADISLSANVSDVRTVGGADYDPQPGGPDTSLIAKWRLSDLLNGSSESDPGTVADFEFPVPVDCVATADSSTGASCGMNTTAEAVMPGVVKEAKQMVVQAFRVRLNDSGLNGTRGDSDDRSFAMQGIYVP